MIAFQYICYISMIAFEMHMNVFKCRCICTYGYIIHILFLNVFIFTVEEILRGQNHVFVDNLAGIDLNWLLGNITNESL